MINFCCFIRSLLLDFMFVADTALLERHFPSGTELADLPTIYKLPPNVHAVSQAPPQSNRYGPKHQAPSGPLTSSSESRSMAYPEQSASMHSSEYPFLQSHSRSHAHSVHNYHQYHDQQGRQHEQTAHSYHIHPLREPETDQSAAHAYYGHHSQPSSHMDYMPSHRHYGMLPPRLPGATEAEQEGDRDRVPATERELLAWNWERETERDRHQGSSDTMPPPPSLGPTGADMLNSSSGYNIASNGHLYGNVHGGSYSLPHATMRSRVRQSRSSSSSSRRRGEEMEVDVDAPTSSDADVDMSLGGPVHLEMALEAARERGRASLSHSVEHVKREDVGGVHEGMAGVRNQGQTPRLHTTRPMAALEPDPPSTQAYRVIHDRQTRDGPITRAYVESGPELVRHGGEGEVHVYGSDPGDFARGRPTARHNSYASRSVSWQRREIEKMMQAINSRRRTAPSGSEGTGPASVGVGVREEENEETARNREEEKDMSVDLRAEGKD